MLYLTFTFIYLVSPTVNIFTSSYHVHPFRLILIVSFATFMKISYLIISNISYYSNTTFIIKTYFF